MNNHPGNRPVYRAMGSLGGIAGFLLFPVLVWAVLVFLSDKVPAGAPGEAGVERLKRLEEVKRVQGDRVSTSGWVDQAAHKVRIPVEAAVQLVLPELRSKKAKLSAMIVPGRAAPVPAPAAAAPAGNAPAQAAPGTSTGGEQKPGTASQTPAGTGNEKGK
jgi:hypothetical protein